MTEGRRVRARARSQLDRYVQVRAEGPVDRFADLVAELKRRRVIRALIGWGIASFAILQVVEPVLHAYHLPEWALTLVVTLLAAGFPLTVVLAWMFDFTPQGVVRTIALPGSEAVGSGPGGHRLTFLLLAIGLLAATPGLLYFLVWPGGARTARGATAVDAAPTGASIAVLPFADMSPEHDQEYLADGIAEEILNALAGMEGLRVPGRTSSFWFKGRAADPVEIGRKLGVATLLEGSVRKEGKHVRVTAQLVNAADGYRIWSETYDRELGGIFQVQDEIARAVVAGLEPRLLGGDGARLRPSRPTRWEAYSQYLRGRRLLARGSWVSWTDATSIRGARDAFERAVALDPGYAPAHAGLAEAMGAAAGELAESPEEVSRLANLERASAQRAIDLDPALADGYVARASHRLSYAWDWSGGLEDVERAVALRPGDMAVAVARSRALLAFNRRAEAVIAARRATELDPLSAVAWAELAHALGVSGAFPEAEAAARRCEQLAPGSCCVHVAWSVMDQGRLDEAASQFSGCEGGPRLSGLAIVLHRMGRDAEARSALEAFIRKEALTSAYAIAEVYALRGERDPAFEWLERARLQHDEMLEHLGHNDSFRSIQDDARWAALLRKMNVPTR